MRYIYIVIGLILVIVGISGMTLLKVKTPLSGEAARVNERVITIDEFREAYEEKAAVSPVPPDKKQFLDDLVSREILIQEAKRLGLDREEAFRRSIQNYYEQTLLKNLTQKKMSDLKVSVSEEEIASYYANMGKIYELGIVIEPSEREANEAIMHFPAKKAVKRRLRVDEIPHEVLDSVLSLRVGEVSPKPIPCEKGLLVFECEKGFLVFRLEGYKIIPVPPLGKIHDEIRKTLEERKRRREMEGWFEGLRKNSRITINDSVLK